MENKELKLKKFKENLAIVILACSEYESLELALATHAKFSTHSGVPIYILINGRGTYDNKRTLEVAERYSVLFPDIIHVVKDIKPTIAYLALKKLFKSKQFDKYTHIIKLDDDVLVLTDDWVDKLCNLYIEKKEQYKDGLAYVTTLVNNNPYGFKYLVDHCKELSDDFYTNVARRHIVGSNPYDPWNPYKIEDKNVINDGGNGSVWRNFDYARWIHKKTTLNPSYYINFSSSFKINEINNKNRYSINCILFEKQLWVNQIDRADSDYDDEHLLHVYCLKYNKKIFCDHSIPMVHLCFAVQRDNLKDMFEEFRNCYINFLNFDLNFYIIYSNKNEIIKRLYWTQNNGKKRCKNFKILLKRLKRSFKEVGFKNTIKLIINKITH